MEVAGGRTTPNMRDARVGYGLGALTVDGLGFGRGSGGLRGGVLGEGGVGVTEVAGGRTTAERQRRAGGKWVRGTHW